MVRLIRVFTSLFTGLFLSLLMLPNLAQAALQLTTDEEALCNNGAQATYSYFEGESKNWLVFVQGGGVALNAQSLKQRLPRQKTPPSDEMFGYHYPMVRDFHERGYHVIVVPYCSSDLYQGNHLHVIDGELVPFKGRIIFEDIIAQHKSQFSAADSLIFAGYSAGAIGLGFNADLIAQFEKARLILDSFWLDSESLRVRQGYQGGRWNEINAFVYPNVPEHCKGSHWANCFPSRAHFDKNGLTDIFPIWNIGDRYARGDRQAVRKSTFSDITHYQAGFTMDAEKRDVKGFEEWGHVMTANDLYTMPFEGQTLQRLIWNWVERKSPAHLILDEEDIPILTNGSTFSLVAPKHSGFRVHNFYSLPKKDHSFTYIKDASGARAGDAYQRFELRAGDCFPEPDGKWNDCETDRERFEFSSQPEQKPQGRECYGYSLKLAKDFIPLDPTNTDLGQVHQIGGPKGTAGGLRSFPPLIQIGASKKHLMFGWHELTGDANNVRDKKRTYKLAKLSDLKGKWTDISFCLDYENNRMDAWVNGKKKVEIKKSPINFMPKVTYFKYGIYRSFISRYKSRKGELPTQIVFYDEVRRGHSVEEVDRNINPELAPID